MGPRLHESLDKQVTLVTGATRGIGKEIASQLTDLAATVYGGARDTDDVTASDQQPVQLDVTSESDVATTVETIAEEVGRLDVLVNNAGVYGPSGKFADTASTDIETTLAVNLHGPIRVSKHSLPLLTEQEGSRIVNVSSGGGQLATGVSTSHAPYGISKAGLNALTSTLAGQYPDLIVNAVCPGWVRTDMGGQNPSRSIEKGAETPVWLTCFAPESPSGRFWRDKDAIDW
jgi:NAD(P)-dependent dehydrogenase (short-subunit alcohol dehydrogenase family)